MVHYDEARGAMPQRPGTSAAPAPARGLVQARRGPRTWLAVGALWLAWGGAARAEVTLQVDGVDAVTLERVNLTTVGVSGTAGWFHDSRHEEDGALFSASVESHTLTECGWLVEASYGFHLHHAAQSEAHSELSAMFLSLRGAIGIPVWQSLDWETTPVSLAVPLGHRPEVKLQTPYTTALWVVAGLRLDHADDDVELGVRLGLRFGAASRAMATELRQTDHRFLLHDEWWIEVGAVFWAPAIAPGAYTEAMFGRTLSDSSFTGAFGLFAEYLPDLDLSGADDSLRLNPVPAVIGGLRLVGGLTLTH